MNNLPIVSKGLFSLSTSGTGSFPAVLFGVVFWPAFFAATFSFILMLDGIECFLHTVRLHWVEFNSKFYKG